MFNFSRRAVDKIKAVVQWHEREIVNPPAVRGSSVGMPTAPHQWAEVTAVSTSGADAGLHSIKLLQKTANAEFEDHASSFTATYAAREVNGGTVPVGSIVQIERAGYKTDSSEPLYIFRAVKEIFPAELTAATAGGDNKWSYTWKRVHEDGSDYEGDPPWTSAMHGEAINGCERDNTATKVNGVDQTPYDEAGIEWEALPARESCPVVFLSIGKDQPFFSVPIQVKYTPCPPEEPPP